MGRPTRYPPPFRAQAVAHVARIRPQYPSTWQAIKAVAAALGMGTDTLRRWVRQAETATGYDQRQRRQQQAELQRLYQENARLHRALLRRGDTAPTPRPSTSCRPTTETARTAAGSSSQRSQKATGRSGSAGAWPR